MTKRNYRAFALILMLVACTLQIFGQSNPHELKKSHLPDFNAYPVYEGKDLGLTFSEKDCKFKIWSPPAEKVNINLYDEGAGGKPFLVKPLKKGKPGVWEVCIKHSLEGKYYTFQVQINGKWLPETPDPYAIAVGVNGQRAMVINISKTNPEGWEHDVRPSLKNPSEIVLYELHVRDASIHPSSGIKHKGKYLGLTELGTKTPEGQSTGLDHIKELGVTHVHLLPVFDFRSIDESKTENAGYNWGYDPQNYNTPEGTYATDPYDGRVRIMEFKQMVKAFHDNGIRVVMDVVYNHTGATEGSVFNQIVPKYYYRLNEDGSFSDASACGNETASERPMVRKFIIESMVYWAKEYHIDGFRVDLMGIHDIETMNQAAAELRKIDPTIFIYGEGWTAGGSPLKDEFRAIKINTLKLDGIAAFSDEFRDGVKGHVFTPEANGFATGEKGLKESVKFGIAGAIDHPQVAYEKVNYSKTPWALQPTQCINYVSCHDNHSLYDRIVNSCQGISEPEIINLIKFMQTIVLTSQGIPFLHAGEEITRTKFGVENSFESGDHINQIVWSNKEKHKDLHDYMCRLIQLRKNHPAFRMGEADEIVKHLKFIETGNDNLIAYLLDGHAIGDNWKRILVVFNGNDNAENFDIPPGEWKIVCRNGQINEEGMGKVGKDPSQVPARSALILTE